MQLELIRFGRGDLKLEVNVSPSEETVWLSLDDMAMLFGRDQSVIGKHVKNALLEECEKNSVWAKFARTGSDGKTLFTETRPNILERNLEWGFFDYEGSFPVVFDAKIDARPS